MKYQIRYQTLKLADLVHPPYNPRVQIERDTPEYDALKRSLEQHELVEPLVVNLCNMHCVGGNQRLTVMRAAGRAERKRSVSSPEQDQGSLGYRKDRGTAAR